MEALSMDEARERLRSLRDHASIASPELLVFAGYLADRISPRADPAGFAIAFHLTIVDLQRGESGFVDHPLPRELVGRHSAHYRLLALECEKLAEVLFPEDFAKEVGSAYRLITDT